jgi:hypothetical protein
MNRRAVALAVATVVYLAPLASAEPILKARKYHGPIPTSSLSLRIGTLGGASNDEMIDYLDGRIQPPLPEPITDDFGNGLTFEIAYQHMPHPRFGVRVNTSLSLLNSSGSGVFVPQIPEVPDTILLPALEYNREFDVQLFVVELSGLYYFTDAAVREFQPYVGGGFSLGFPHEEYTETRVDQDTGEPYTDEIPGIPSQADEWGFSAGVHAVTGAVYYLTNRWGASAEARIQMMEGKFEQLAVPNEVGDMENVNFVVDYSGFFLTIGATYTF